MSLESPEWFMLGWLALVAIIASLAPIWSPRPRSIGRFARTVGLPLDGDVELERTIGERLRLRAKWGALGTVIGAIAGVPIVLSGALTTHPEWGGPSVAPFAAIVLLGVLLAGRGVGVAISILPAPPEVRRNGPRISRLPRPTAGEYVAPIERVGARALVVVSGLLAAATAAPPIATETRILAGVAGIGAIATLVVVEWASSALVSRPQPAVSELLLRWDDALRAQTLRDLVSVPLMFGLLAIVTSISAASQWASALGDIGKIAVSVFTSASFFTLLVVLAFSIAVRPARYYLKRLWPVQFAETQPRPYGEASTVEGA